MNQLLRCTLPVPAFAGWPLAEAEADTTLSAAEAIRKALRSLPGLQAPTDAQIKEFWGRLEEYFNGNRPALVTYLGRLALCPRAIRRRRRRGPGIPSRSTTTRATWSTPRRRSATPGGAPPRPGCASSSSSNRQGNAPFPKRPLTVAGRT